MGQHVGIEHARHSPKIEDARRDAAWVRQESDSGFPLLHAHSVVSVWSAIEVLAEDFAIAWLRNVPAAWQVPEVAKLKIQVGRFHQLGESERAAFVVSELSRTFAPEVRRGVGQLKALLGVFNLWPAVGPNLQKALHELCQVRNVLVHFAGRADQKLVEECPWLGVAVGKEVAIPHALYVWYLTAARLLADRVHNQGTLALGFSGCKCPGLDEVKERPVQQLGAMSSPTTQ